MKVFQCFSALVLFIQLALATKFSDIKLSNHAFKITDSNYEKILLEYRQDYTVVLFLTATAPSIGCTLCTEFIYPFDQLAMSFNTNLKAKGSSATEEDNILFASADFQDAVKFFKSLGLNNVPKVYILKKGGNSASPDFEYAFVNGDHLALLKQWIAKTLPTLDQSLLKIIEVVDYSAIFLNVFATVSVLFLVYYWRKQLLALISKPSGWQSFSIVILILFTSGYMYNEIRNTPYNKQMRDGTVKYIAPGQQNQYAAETQILSIVYGVLTVLMIVLIEKIPSIKSNNLKLLSTIAVAVLATFVYNLLISIFRDKSRGYPLSLFF